MESPDFSTVQLNRNAAGRQAGEQLSRADAERLGIDPASYSPVTIHMTRTAKTNTGNTWPQGSTIHTSDEELARRGLPADSYRRDEPAASDAVNLNDAATVEVKAADADPQKDVEPTELDPSDVDPGKPATDTPAAVTDDKPAAKSSKKSSKKSKSSK